MPLYIAALDNQFAVSTGTNVNSGPGTSTFDYPPNSTLDLVIESQPGDPSPYIFSPGDTYTLSFGGQGGGTIENATVLRSDFIDTGTDSGHAIVFEGLDQNGDLTQVVWTPEFDLETWYWDNFSGGNPPGFYNTDQDAMTTYQAVCFEASMRVAAPDGPRRADQLASGDALWTRDNGAQPIKWVGARQVRGWGRHAPIVFAEGAIGNPEPLVLSQQHRILVDVYPERDQFDAPEVLVPAVAFVNGRSIRVSPRKSVTYVHFLLDRHELLVSAGVVCESLYMGPISREVLLEKTNAVETGIGASAPPPEVHHSPARPFLSVREGSRLLTTLSGVPPRKIKSLIPKGRKNACDFHLDPTRGLDMPGVFGQPAFAALRDTETREGARGIPT